MTYCLWYSTTLNYILLSEMSLFSIQSVTAPNGLIAHMFGPVVGRRHDAFMLSISGLQEKLANIKKQDGTPYVIYGDLAYGVSSTILPPFHGSSLTAQQQEFNKAMSHVRVSVEWTFGIILANFSYLDLKRNTRCCCSLLGSTT